MLYFRLGLDRKDTPKERMEYVFEFTSAINPIGQKVPSPPVSLNDLFENTSMLYYARKRSSSVNVFNEFKMNSPGGARLGELWEKVVFVKVWS
ncbi:MAG TPA: hypothetical protein PKA00_15235 [Saprospiraceae bacterium]|nr:hypothetical protein [Saprospiraceae bacterium]HMQ84265.1 hypothetical protein [Saprospiraceae bacterium]